MEADKKYLIPKHMDDLPMIIFVELDTFIVFAVGMFIGIYFNHPYIISLPTIVFAYWYNAKKNTHHKGFIYHSLYKFGIVSPPKMPPYFIKEFGD